MTPNPSTHSTPKANVIRTLPILDSGSCEPLKAVIHGAALGLCALMGSYNAAAWLRRRQKHLAVNAVIYFCGVIWERHNVAHHLAACVRTACPESAAVDSLPAIVECSAGDAALLPPQTTPADEARVAA